MTEAANADLDSYATFNEFFTRELKAGARPIASGAGTLVAPADGVLTEHGADRRRPPLPGEGQHLHARRAARRDAAPPSTALEGGRYFTIYLAPHNYHRVHAPLAARLDAHALHSRRALQREPRDGRRNPPPLLPQRARRLLVRDGPRPDGRRARRRAERLEHQHVRARRDRERRCRGTGSSSRRGPSPAAARSAASTWARRSSCCSARDAFALRARRRATGSPCAWGKRSAPSRRADARGYERGASLEHAAATRRDARRDPRVLRRARRARGRDAGAVERRA